MSQKIVTTREVYDALRRLAERRLAGERAGHMLQATALVHEVYLKLSAGSGPAQEWADTAHFYHVAAEAMRQVLVDQARSRLAQKRGGGRDRVPLTESIPDVATLTDAADPDRVLDLERAVTRLAAVSADAAAVVNLRFYAGLTVEQVAAALGLSVATVNRKWTYARLFLFRELSRSANS